MPSLSVVMCNYNHGQYIARAIEAILSQSCQPDELIILDDCSTDDSDAIIAAYAASYPTINFFRNDHNVGGLASVAKALAMVRGDYVYSAAADDYTLPNFFAEGMRMAEQYPRAGIIFGPMLLIDPEGKECGRIEVPAWQETRFVSPADFIREYIDRESPGHSLGTATIYRMAPLSEIGGFRSELGHWCDSFAARAIGLKYGACYMSSPCAAWRVVPGSIATSANRSPILQMAIAARATKLMRSLEFRDRFPENHVRRWERDHYALTLTDEYRSAVKVAARTIYEHLHPHSVIDMDCGAGMWLSEFQYLGAQEIKGVTDASGAVPVMNPEIAHLVSEHNFSNPFTPERKYDLCLCLGLPSRMLPKMEENIIVSCAAASDTILFAFPPRGGNGYLNRKPLEHWSRKFLDRGYLLSDEVRTLLPDSMFGCDELNILLAKKTKISGFTAETLADLVSAKDARIEKLFQKTQSIRSLQDDVEKLTSLLNEVNELLRGAATFPLALQPAHISHRAGRCYVFTFRSRMGRFYSHLTVFAESVVQENGVSLCHGNALHDDIRSQGGGRYSLWRDAILFSSTDDSDPRTNGKTYTILLPATIGLIESLNDQMIHSMGL